MNLRRQSNHAQFREASPGQRVRKCFWHTGKSDRGVVVDKYYFIVGRRQNFGQTVQASFKASVQIVAVAVVATV